jgi:hypothetical protein
MPQRPKRIGSELLADSDKLGRRIPLPDDCLPFSHGRAALAWLLEKFAFKSALICAYTCPVVPRFFRNKGLKLDYFDVGEYTGQVLYRALRLEPPRIILLPALFGQPPWVDRNEMLPYLEPEDLVIIDAAQTAFGHLHFEPPVFSCPRKRLAINDGAVLRLVGGLQYRSELKDLPLPIMAPALKAAARKLWAEGKDDEAFHLHKTSEVSWPDIPMRMTDESLEHLECADQAHHITTRKNNLSSLVKALNSSIVQTSAEAVLTQNDEEVPFRGVPFSLPLMVPNPEPLIASLRGQRIYLTRLWPTTEYSREHTKAEQMARYLVSLPVDQRHNEEDMQRLAAAVVAYQEYEQQCLMERSGKESTQAAVGGHTQTRGLLGTYARTSNQKKLH